MRLVVLDHVTLDGVMQRRHHRDVSSCLTRQGAGRA
jgi:hypothetical protein